MMFFCHVVSLSEPFLGKSGNIVLTGFHLEAGCGRVGCTRVLHVVAYMLIYFIYFLILF